MDVSWGDRITGLVLGLILGIAIVAIFVFVFSEETIDSAELDRGGTAVEHERQSAP